MNIQADSNNIYVTIDSPETKDGQPFSSTLDSIDWKGARGGREYRKFKPNCVQVEIPYKVFVETVKLWNVQFNTIGDVETKKTVENIISLANVIAFYSQPDYKTIEHDLINKYGTVKNQSINFKFENMSLYNTDYMLIIYPQKFNQFNAQLVPIDSYNALSDKERVKHFFLAIKIPLSYLSDQLTDKKEIPSSIGNSLDVIIPTATSEQELKDTRFEDNFFFLINSITPTDKDSSDIMKRYLQLGGLAACPESITSKKEQDKKKKAFIFKAWHTDNVYQIIVANNIKHSGSKELFITGKIIYLYSELLFPLYVHIEQPQADIQYNYCTDSKKRSRYGFFSEGYLGIELEKDKPLFDNFDGFFLYDNQKNIKVVEVGTKSLSVPDFK